jgi:hypothetical protein
MKVILNIGLNGPMAVRWLPFCHSAFIYPEENVL